jgi:hypothetical protein
VAVIDASVNPDGAPAATRLLREAAGSFGLLWIAGAPLGVEAAAALAEESGHFLAKPFSPRPSPKPWPPRRTANRSPASRGRATWRQSNRIQR